MHLLAYSRPIKWQTIVLSSTGLVHLIKHGGRYLCFLVMLTTSTASVYFYQCYVHFPHIQAPILGKKTCSYSSGDWLYVGTLLGMNNAYFPDKGDITSYADICCNVGVTSITPRKHRTPIVGFSSLIIIKTVH